jgi:hypothetical protein
MTATISAVTGFDCFVTPQEYFVLADFPHQMSYLRPALLYYVTCVTPENNWLPTKITLHC